MGAYGVVRGKSAWSTVPWLAWLLIARGACAQTPLPAPNLDLLGNGYVYSIAVQPDGAVIIGGSFVSINGIARNNIARLLPNGTLDPDWNPSPDAYVEAVAVDSSGAVYAGGAFSHIGGLPRRGIARLTGPGGSVDADWNASASTNGYVQAIAVNASGIYAVVLGSEVVKLTAASGAMVASWQAGPVYANYIVALAIDRSGAVFAGGGLNLPVVIKLDGETGRADPNWIAPTLGTFNQSVTALATGSDGSVFVGGTFGARKLSGATGEIDANWTSPETPVATLLVDDAHGAVFASRYDNQAAAQARGSVAKVSANTGAPLPGWNVTSNGYVGALALTANGSVLAGGGFSAIGGHERLGFAMLSSTGSAIGKALDLEYPGTVFALAAQPSGGMIVGGPFLKVGQQSRRHLLRLEADGTLDQKWDPSTDGNVDLLAVGLDGAVYAHGEFSTIGGRARAGLAKVSGTGNGAVDAQWNSSTDGDIYALVADADALYVGGGFATVGGQPRRAIAKLSGDTGAVDPNWDAAPDTAAVVVALARATDGSIYAGGGFSSIGGLPRANLAKLSPATGQADPVWNPAPAGAVYSLATDPAGAVLAGGQFGSIGGQQRLLIAKISGSGDGAAADWDAGFVEGFVIGGLFPDYVYPLGVDGSGNVFASGLFTIQGSGGALDYESLRFAKMFAGGGSVDRDWNPFATFGYGDQPVDAFATAADGSIYMGGYFKLAGGERRYGLAAFAATTRSEAIFANGFE